MRVGACALYFARGLPRPPARWGATAELAPRRALGTLLRTRLSRHVVSNRGLATTIRRADRSGDQEKELTMAEFTEGECAEDPHAHLEVVLGEAQLQWVKERNEDCLEKTGDPKKTVKYERILGALDSKEKIPAAYRIGSRLYNFWQDETHVQGIWRSTTFESYVAKGETEWRTALDLDALAPPTTGTAKTWVWHGSRLLDEGTGDCDRALISLSPGGSDADTTREFDLKTETFVGDAEGFHLKTAAKSQVGFRTRDEVLVGTDFGEGSLTDSGYPRVVKSWKRGEALEDAVTIFEGDKSDVSVSQYAYLDRGVAHEFQLRSLTFYTSKYLYRAPDLKKRACEDPTPFVEVPIPADASLGTFQDLALVTLRTDWTSSRFFFEAGSLVAVPLADLMDGAGNLSRAQCLFTPTASASLSSTTTTKNFLILKVLDDVITKLVVWKFNKSGTFEAVEAKAAAVTVGEDLGVSGVSRFDDSDDELWLWRDGFLVPSTLEYCADAAHLLTEEASVRQVRALPAMFDSSGLKVEQHFATSIDGTRVPYFQIGPSNLRLDGSNPTLLDAYGGFEISMLPYYSAGKGVGWLELGGVSVIANVRGGGEYGPKWHQAALKEKRPRCYEDVEAVAADLVWRMVTKPPKLAVIGGSNGGLMVGNMLTRPRAAKLFGAAVCQVPLLDMKRYTHLLAGASWAAEYGDPDDPAQWASIRTFSPYHVLRHDRLGLPEQKIEGPTTTTTTNNNKLPEDPTAAAAAWICPKVLFTTSTRDDRVHPGHARKMVKALLDDAPRDKAPLVLYWENTEGGHGGAADNKQRAFMWALTYQFLHKVLFQEDDADAATVDASSSDPSCGCI